MILFSEPITVVIPIDAILKTLIHFGKELPVIFIYAHPKIGCLIRENLSMVSKCGPYYDPASTTGKFFLYSSKILVIIT